MTLAFSSIISLCVALHVAVLFMMMSLVLSNHMNSASSNRLAWSGFVTAFLSIYVAWNHGIQFKFSYGGIYIS